MNAGNQKPLFSPLKMKGVYFMMKQLDNTELNLYCTHHRPVLGLCALLMHLA